MFLGGPSGAAVLVVMNAVGSLGKLGPAILTAKIWKE